ncbi:MAG: hypothetical protein QF444_02920 [Phycisphaerales bacterium]|jgi:hypothetical protein|nr:hypothetical protein [Phycisphaerales bacterium]
MFEAILFSCILSGMPVEVPDHLAEMALPDTSIISGTTYYLAQNVENASDLNDGLSPTYEGKSHGPWKTLNGPRNQQLQLLPGDAIEFHEGVYLLDSTVWSLP